MRSTSSRWHPHIPKHYCYLLTLVQAQGCDNAQQDREPAEIRACPRVAEWAVPKAEMASDQCVRSHGAFVAIPTIIVGFAIHDGQGLYGSGQG